MATEGCTTAGTAGHPEVEEYSDGVSTWRYVGPHQYCPREMPDGPVAGATALLENPDYVRGYPRRFTDCDENQISDNSLTTDDSHNGRVMMGADGEVATVNPGHLRWNTSGARGMSGSPHFYCPSGDCADGHWITGVFAYMLWDACPGWGNPEFCTVGQTAGPRASSIRDWVIANK